MKRLRYSIVSLFIPLNILIKQTLFSHFPNCLLCTIDFLIDFEFANSTIVCRPPHQRHIASLNILLNSTPFSLSYSPFIHRIAAFTQSSHLNRPSDPLYRKLSDALRVSESNCPCSVSSHEIGFYSPFFNPSHIFRHDNSTVTSVPPNSLSTTLLFTTSSSSTCFSSSLPSLVPLLLYYSLTALFLRHYFSE